MAGFKSRDQEPDTEVNSCIRAKGTSPAQQLQWIDVETLIFGVGAAQTGGKAPRQVAGYPIPR